MTKIISFFNNKGGVGKTTTIFNLSASLAALRKKVLLSALYCSDYFLVPCTPDSFCAYCITLIVEVLPSFVDDWNQGQRRYKMLNPFDKVISSKGQPKFAGWIFNGFDARKYTSTQERKETGADKFHLDKIIDKVEKVLIPRLEQIGEYQCVPEFVDILPIAKIEDLNVMASEIQKLNVPLKYLSSQKPSIYSSWSYYQKDLMIEMDKEYDLLAKFIIKNCNDN